MPTNDERREVAARLRREIFSLDFALDCLLRIALGEGRCNDNDCEECRENIINRLANLIEPEPERTCHIELDWDAMEDQISGYRIWRCSCGESFLFFRGRKPSFCPECGAKVAGE